MRLVLAGALRWEPWHPWRPPALIAALLFKTEPADPATFAIMILLLGAVALIAGYIPARRASRIDPMIALRGN